MIVLQGNKRISTQEAAETNRILINKVETFTESKNRRCLWTNGQSLLLTQQNVLLEKKLCYLEQRNLESQ